MPLWLGLWCAVLMLGAGTAYLAWLDTRARSAFSQARWALPARVYARAIELYETMPMGRDALLSHLRELGYAQSAAVTGPGQFAVRGTGLELQTRGFQFWDATVGSVRASLEVDAARINVLTLADPAGVPIVRLEPVEIAQFVPRARQDRMLVAHHELPGALIDALLATEDRRFYSHFGVDPLGLLRALIANAQAGRIVQGGSTLTQQLVKNLFLTRERTWWRKFNEALLAILLERRFDKNAILEAYANEVFLGQDGERAIHGFALASRFYFGKPLAELRVEEIATLVAMVRGPTVYDPRRNPDAARARRDVVLDMMVGAGRLDSATAARAKATALHVSARSAAATRFPAFIDLVRLQLREDYPDSVLESEGLRIFTTLDLAAQRAAERAVSGGLRKLEATYQRVRKLQAAVVVADVATGEVRALVGDRDPRYRGYNRALHARRPIGSLVKPAIYLAAVRGVRGHTAASMIDDAPLEVPSARGKIWRPRNYDGRARGPVLLADALAQSLNLATVRLAMELGYDPVFAALKDLGIERPLPEVPAVYLGAIDLTPVEVARMYHTIANGGFASRLQAIRDVTKRDGAGLNRYPLSLAATVAPEHAFVLGYLLQRVVDAGTARRAAGAFGAVTPVAGKTGTTNSLRDSWFAGQAGDRVAVVWVGRDDNEPAGLSGAMGALPIWIDAMRGAAPAALPAAVPDTIQWQWVDTRSGAATEAQCGHAILLPFVVGTLPVGSQPCSH